MPQGLSSKGFWVLFAGAVVLAAGGYLYGAAHMARAEGPIEVRWLLSHQPVGVFAHATQVFSEALKKESDGQMELSVIDPAQVGVGAGSDIPNAQVFKELDSGAAEIATAYTVALGTEDPAMWAVNMPFLFGSYDGANKALDSAAGQALLDTFAPSDARALAFTMSGGYRIIATKDKKISSANDFKGLRIVTSGGPVEEAALAALGATPVSADLEGGSQPFDPSTIDGVDTTYSRLAQAAGQSSPYAKYLNETNHSMFLTAIVVNRSFFDSLSPQNQKALTDAARAAADAERQDSIALDDSTKQALEKSGSVVTTLSPAAEEELAAKTQSVYAKFSSIPSALVDALRAAQ